NNAISQEWISDKSLHNGKLFAVLDIFMQGCKTGLRFFIEDIFSFSLYLERGKLLLVDITSAQNQRRNQRHD
ncbi:MAG: hypothetical protein IT346_01985, partial [Epsilonproteobacteria bacterium]|nr:hypothetical protein [Campylobacterota bacterium]